MRSGFRKKWDDINLKAESVYRKLEYQKKAKLRLKRMNGGFNCSKEYEEIVVPFWKRYGLKPSKMWYQIFSDREKKVDPRYIPDDLWYGVIVPYFSNTQFRRFGEDKCMHDIFFKEFTRPETIIKNIAGVFYDSDMNVISMEQAVKNCLDYPEEFLIKPSIDSGEGRLISFFEKEKKDKESITAVMHSLKANYIAQEAVKQHPVLSELNPSSLNTIRIVSFFFEGEVHILSSILRMGASGHKVDNIGAGGFACPIQKDGHLAERGVNRKAEWVSENQHGIRFAEVQVPSYEKIVGLVKKQHRKLAHFKLIGWDFSVSGEGEPVFIEYNVCPGSNQITCGPTFGDLTEHVLDEVFVKKTLKYAQN
ncbi:sugar-transfer associated ATP-grasp domain-containing protein [Blautia pseudococcoides]|uniref:sugar-transfer associated ATP-grasp domain-containing protein n=1 Tax=Blautia pseudococcoides TaxID=1796616 RepID=UPI00148B09BA|nr:sugar-transfer associated ATP-grasp domain-containing protein [Blautia pseudococcoides]QJU16977.1 hexapeptide transferase [Blautia pseudococcoides]